MRVNKLEENILNIYGKKIINELTSERIHR